MAQAVVAREGNGSGCCGWGREWLEQRKRSETKNVAGYVGGDRKATTILEFGGRR
ncbi:hypothetical protein Csa_009331 [Cucumis sativus]|nr:hypothetical protein Csa_009331 [Cucumis sativus]